MYITTFTVSYVDHNGNSDVATFVKELDARDFVKTTLEDFLDYEMLEDTIASDEIDEKVDSLFNFNYLDYYPSKYVHIEFMFSVKGFDIPTPKVEYLWGHHLNNNDWVIDPNRIAYFQTVTETINKVKPNGWDHAVYKKADTGREYIVLCGDPSNDRGRYIPVDYTSAAYALTLVLRCAFDE